MASLGTSCWRGLIELTSIPIKRITQSYYHLIFLIGLERQYLYWDKALVVRCLMVWLKNWHIYASSGINEVNLCPETMWHCVNWDNLINSLRTNDTIWWQGSSSALVQAMACCLTAPSHYLNQCWLIISEVRRHSPGRNFMRDVPTINR